MPGDLEPGRPGNPRWGKGTLLLPYWGGTAIPNLIWRGRYSAAMTYATSPSRAQEPVALSGWSLSCSIRAQPLGSSIPFIGSLVRARELSVGRLRLDSAVMTPGVAKSSQLGEANEKKVKSPHGALRYPTPPNAKPSVDPS